MENFGDFKDITSITWFFVVTFLIGTIIPGILLIYVFHENLFLSMETMKLILLSIGISTPVWYLNTAIIMIATDDDKQYSDKELKHDMQLVGVLGSLITMPVLFFPVLFKLFIDIQLKTAFYIVVVLEVLVVVTLLLFFNSKKKTSK